MRRITRLRLLALTAFVGALALISPAALAQSAGGQDGDPFLSVRSVDSTDGAETVLGLTWKMCIRDSLASP